MTPRPNPLRRVFSRLYQHGMHAPNTADRAIIARPAPGNTSISLVASVEKITVTVHGKTAGAAFD